MSKAKAFMLFAAFGILIVLALGVIAMWSSTHPVEPKEKSGPKVSVEKADPAPAPEVVEEEPAQEESFGGEGKPGNAEYQAIKKGMTREQVEMLFEVIEIVDVMKINMEGYKSETVIYAAEGDFGSTISVTYVNGVVDVTSSFGFE